VTGAPAAARPRVAPSAPPRREVSTPAAERAIARIERAMRAVNRIVVLPCMAALVVASAVLTYSVLARYLLKIPTDWQDEISVFLLVGATFLSAAFVQAQRGHVAIEVLGSLLPARINRARLAVADAISLAFCGLFAWKSWTLLREAWVEGQTSNSSFAPPMWIPYSLMSVGMTLLTLQLAVGLLGRLHPPAHDDGSGGGGP
jgi:TRAP-type C4-dicarboxylate transport system permease small subunit